MPDEDQLLLVVADPRAPSGRVERGVSDALVATGLTKLNVSVLRRNMRVLLGQLQSILQDGETTEGVMVLHEVTVAAQIMADGQVGILGCGATLQAQSAITLTLRRRE